MLKLKTIIPAVLLVIAGCSEKIRTTSSGSTSKSQTDSLYVVLKMNEVIKTGEKINLKFIVHNDHPIGKSFCKWQTPFEPLLSKYLDIEDEQGNQVAYKGPMAKRIMPPPTDSYLFVNPKDTLATEVDLSKSYQLEEGKTYVVAYNSGGVSGLKASNTVSFKLTR